MTKKSNSKEAKVLLEKEFNKLVSDCNNDFNLVCDSIGYKLRDCREMVYKSIVPNIIKKSTSEESCNKWIDLIKDPKMLEELGKIGVSIANTLRPVAGNTFADWVCKSLNGSFTKEGLSLRCETSGKYKKIINDYLKELKEVVNQETGELILMDQKPDIDIVLYNPSLEGINSILAILSCKTTLAERVMQTISWKNYISNVLSSDIPVYLVTAWEDFKSDTVNKERVQSLAGVFVCNENVTEFGNIKKSSKMVDVFKSRFI